MASIQKKKVVNKIPIRKKMQFLIILLPDKKFVTEKGRMQPSKFLSSNGFVVNTL